MLVRMTAALCDASSVHLVLVPLPSSLLCFPFLPSLLFFLDPHGRPAMVELDADSTSISHHSFVIETAKYNTIQIYPDTLARDPSHLVRARARARARGTSTRAGPEHSREPSVALHVSTPRFRSQMHRLRSVDFALRKKKLGARIHVGSARSRAPAPPRPPASRRAASLHLLLPPRLACAVDAGQSIGLPRQDTTHTYTCKTPGHASTAANRGRSAPLRCAHTPTLHVTVQPWRPATRGRQCVGFVERETVELALREAELDERAREDVWWRTAVEAYGLDVAWANMA